MARNKKILDDFCRDSIKELLKKNEIGINVGFDSTYSLRSFNGKTAFDNANSTASIVVNYHNIPDETSFFNLYNTIAHEIYHIKTWMFEVNNKSISYDTFISTLERLYYVKTMGMDINNSKLKANDFFKFQIFLRKNSYTLPSDINADYDGYKEALAKFFGELTDEEINNYNNIIESLAFIKDNLQIIYGFGNEPLHTFQQFFIASSLYVRENPLVLEYYPILSFIFNENGLLKPLGELYELRKKYPDLIDRFLLELLQSVDFDKNDVLKSMLSHDIYKEYINNIISDSINSTISYYKNEQKGLVFLNQSVLNDNLLFKKKSALYLRQQALKHGLELHCGLILDSRIMARTRNMVREKQK
jgi:hypothetical protein